MGIRERWNERRVGNVAALIAAASGIASVLLAAEPTRGPARAAHQPAAAAMRAASSEEAAFLDSNRFAMTTMMSGMAIEPTGDVDRDFVHMMVPHHQGAIDMATAVLRYGHDPVLRRLAQEIVVTQQEEIAAMRRAVGEPLPPSLAAPTSPSRGNEMGRRP
jgi:uncharacterized protein (DUF305 family)